MYPYNRKNMKQKKKTRCKEAPDAEPIIISIEVFSSNNKSEKLKLFISLAASIATILTVVVMFFTLIEMNRQRVSSYIPNLVFMPSKISIDHDEDMLEWSDEWIYTIPNTLPEIQIKNLGDGAARNIDIEWDTAEFDNEVTDITDVPDEYIVCFYPCGDSYPSKIQAIGYAIMQTEQEANDDIIDVSHSIYRYGTNIHDRLLAMYEQSMYAGVVWEDGFHYQHTAIHIDYIFEQSVDDSTHYISIPQEILGEILLYSEIGFLLYPEFIPNIYINVRYFDVFGTQYSSRISMKIGYDMGGAYYNAVLSFNMD